jgi:hypothetical protein
MQQSEMRQHAPPKKMNLFLDWPARDIALREIIAGLENQLQSTELHHACLTNEDEERPARCYKCNSANNMLPGRTFCTSNECVADRAAGDALFDLD